MQIMKKAGWAFAILLCSTAGYGLQPIDDQALSNQVGEGGITMVVTNPGNIGYDTTGATPTNFFLNPNNGVAASSATFEINGLQIKPIGNGGAASGSGLSSTIVLDSGADASGGGFGLTATWARQRVLNDRLLLLGGDAPSSAPYATPAAGATGATQYVFGQTAFDGSGTFKLATSRGLLSTNGTVDANMQARLTIGPSTLPTGNQQFALYTSTAGYGQFYYRQDPVTAGSPQLVLDNFFFDAGFAPGTGGMIGACTSAASSSCGYTNNKFASGSSGFYLATPRLDFNMTFDFNMQAAPTTSLQTSTAANSYTTTAQSLAVWGWQGDFSGNGGGATSNVGAGLLIGGGGVWPNSAVAYNPDTPASRLDGINIAFHGNYDPSNFAWYVGRAGEVLSFGGWQTIPGVDWSLSAPNITLAPVKAGQGPGGLCWGASAYVGTGGSCGSYNKPTIPGTTLAVTGQYLDTNGLAGKSPNNTNAGSGANAALGLFIRDLHLQAYSTNVQLFDDLDQAGNFTGTALNNAGATVSKTITEPWALIYTLGQMDGNIYLYPGNGAAGNGLTADVVLMTQSFQNNANPAQYNSNFLIGETCTPASGTANCNIPNPTTWCNPSCTMGIGLMQSDMLFAANQLNLNLNNASATDGAGVQFNTNDLRIQIQGLFAGGFLRDQSGSYAMAQPGFNTTATTAGQNMVVGSFVDLNLEATAARLTVSPQLTTYNGPGGKPYPYMGLAGHFTFISPGATNNSANVGGTAPTASAIDLQPASCGTVASRTCDGTYFSLAEPYAPTSDVRFSTLQGDLTILASASSSPTPSQVFLMSSADPSFSDGKPRLRIANTLAIGGCADGGGATAGSCGSYATGAMPLSAIVKLDTSNPALFNGTVGMSNSPNALGTMVIPNAQIYSSIVLRPQ